MNQSRKFTWVITIPWGHRLLGSGDRLEPGDEWFNFITGKWELMDWEFQGLSCENCIAIRTLPLDEIDLGAEQ